MKQPSILIVDDNKSLLKAMELLFSGRCRKLGLLSSPNLMLDELGKNEYDLLLLDMNFSSGINQGNEGIYWLQRVLERFPSQTVIMITAFGDIELAVRAIKLGAFEFVTKPWDNARLMSVVDAAWKFAVRRRELASRLPNSPKTGIHNDFFLAGSRAWSKVMQTVSKVAPTQANVLITGENGTGKELVAREIHHSSQRCHKPFVTIDVGSLPEGLFESELFGYRKGAFTDAREDKKGRIEEADGGTLFLDEIGNLSISMQLKLLTVLQHKRVIPLGSTEEKAVDMRLICATNANLHDRISDGLFRQDLLYRINTIEIELPPLRERKEDIPGLARFFINQFAREYQKPEMQLSDEAMALLINYPWPGNVRELRHAIEKSVILCEDHLLKASDFFFRQFDAETSQKALSGTLEEMEARLIESAMARHNGNISAAASQLGISRQTLYNKVKKYGLS